ncbi:MAG: radical SAM protein [Candidatus Hydrogenedentota bacterium]
MVLNKVLLINPFINPKTQKKFVTDVINISFPLSLGHLIGYLLRNGPFPVGIIDEQIEPINNVEGVLSSMESPKIIGISTLTSTSRRAFQLAEEIKKIDEKVLIILGGVHPTVTAEDCLKNKYIDIVVKGEGEETLDELINRVFNEKDYRDIAGISYKADGKIIHNKDRKLVTDLDIFPSFPYFIFEKNKDRYPGFASIQSSRGCPYGCIFCSQRSVSGRTYRYQSIPRTISDIKSLIDKYHPKTIRIMDDNIGANKSRLIDLLDAIISNKLHKGISFTAALRGDNIDEDIACKLKMANFNFLSFGLETASNSLMKIINKGETVEDVIRAIHLTKSKGITTATTVIFGLPTEKSKDRWDAIKLVNSLKLDSVRFNILTPYPGTPVYERLKKENKIHIKKDWENFSVQYIWEGEELPYVPAGTDKYELIFMIMFANLSFYLSPHGLWKILTTPLAGGNVVALPKKWYLSNYFFKILRVGIYLVTRFLLIFFKMIAVKMSIIKSDARISKTLDEW